MMTYADASCWCQSSQTVDEAAGCGRYDSFWCALAVHLSSLHKSVQDIPCLAKKYLLMTV